jgi:MFS family permease
MFLLAVSLSPSLTAFPGSAFLQTLANGVAAWALVGALIALVLGAGLWAFGNHAQHFGQSNNGRKLVVGSLIAALLIGAAPTLINFFFAAGTHVH